MAIIITDAHIVTHISMAMVSRVTRGRMAVEKPEQLKVIVGQCVGLQIHGQIQAIRIQLAIRFMMTPHMEDCLNGQIRIREAHVQDIGIKPGQKHTTIIGGLLMEAGQHGQILHIITAIIGRLKQGQCADIYYRNIQQFLLRLSCT